MGKKITGYVVYTKIMKDGAKTIEIITVDELNKRGFQDNEIIIRGRSGFIIEYVFGTLAVTIFKTLEQAEEHVKTFKLNFNVD